MKFLSKTIVSLLLPEFRETVPTNWLLDSTLKLVLDEVTAATWVLISIGEVLTIFGKVNLNSCSFSIEKFSPNQTLPSFLGFLCQFREIVCRQKC